MTYQPECPKLLRTEKKLLAVKPKQHKCIPCTWNQCNDWRNMALLVSQQNVQTSWTCITMQRLRDNPLTKSKEWKLILKKHVTSTTLPRILKSLPMLAHGMRMYCLLRKTRMFSSVRYMHSKMPTFAKYTSWTCKRWKNWSWCNATGKCGICDRNSILYETSESNLPQQEVRVETKDWILHSS